MKKLILMMMTVAALAFVGCANDSSDSADSDNSNQAAKNNGNQNNSVEYMLSFDCNVPEDTDDYYWQVGSYYTEAIEGSNFNPNLNASESVPPAVTATTDEELILPIIARYYYKVETSTTKIIGYTSNRDDYEWRFVHWNTEKDGSGTSYTAGDKISLTENLTLYAIYKIPNSSDDSDDDTNILDIYKTSEFSMKVGESVTLKASWSVECYYTIMSNDNNAISISGTTLTANAIGTAIVKMTSTTSSSSAGYCTITVTEDGFEGSVIENMLLGTWKCSGSSYSATLVFNSDMTGHIKATLSSSTVHDNDFTWSAFEGKSSKYFTLSGTGISGIDCQHILTNITSTKFVMSGTLAFGFPSTTTWYKQ